MTESSNTHVLIYSFPCQGHLLPTIDLTNQLANHGLTITILLTPKNLAIFNPLLTKHPSINTLILPFPTHPSVPPGVENLKDVPPSGPCIIDFMTALSQLHAPLLNWFQNHPSPPLAIISDFFSAWTQKTADQLGIPRYVFSETGALSFSLIESLWEDRPMKKKVNGDDEEVIYFNNLPNCPNYPWWQISSIYRAYVQGLGKDDIDGERVREGFVSNLACHGVLINSFFELEHEYVDYLKRKMGHERVWSIGPLPPLDESVSGPIQRGGSSSMSSSEITSWLDRCEKGSVVYISFGSQHVLKNKHMETIALSLEESGVKFIWLVKSATTGLDKQDYGTIPFGFIDRVAGRGLVIKEWAPQVVILRHPAIGAFLTHCGWNSSIESIVAGVPMLAWPMTADQYANATLLVDELKVAIRVGQGERISPQPCDLVKHIDPCGIEKSRSLELKREAIEAIGVDGSSFQNWNEFVMDLGQFNDSQLSI
ncbi:hypothetical protein Leryth_001744 [Lithospermum erythrorhizon]|nr:hypothetical protein Leryth_001744 [Lithospermum erythrorhizon]